LLDGWCSDLELLDEVGDGTPLSASLRIATIWVSLNFDFRMTAPDAEQSTYEP